MWHSKEDERERHKVNYGAKRRGQRVSLVTDPELVRVWGNVVMLCSRGRD